MEAAPLKGHKSCGDVEHGWAWQRSGLISGFRDELFPVRAVRDRDGGVKKRGGSARGHLPCAAVTG